MPDQDSPSIDAPSPPDARRYEVSVLIGPCSEEDAKRAMQAAHEAADALVPGAGTALNWWDEEDECPGSGVDGVEILG